MELLYSSQDHTLFPHPSATDPVTSYFTEPERYISSEELQEEEEDLKQQQDPQTLILTTEEIESLTQFNADQYLEVMDPRFPHQFATERTSSKNLALPPGSSSSETSLEDNSLRRAMTTFETRLPTPLTDANPAHSWASTPTSSSFQDSMNYYRYPQYQLPTSSYSSSHGQDLSRLQPRSAGSMVSQQFDMHSSQLQFPVNSATYPSHYASSPQVPRMTLHAPYANPEMNFPSFPSYPQPQLQQGPSSSQMVQSPYGTMPALTFPFSPANPHPTRSHSYGEVAPISQAPPLRQSRRMSQLNSYEDSAPILAPAPEEFTDSDIDILKSLLQSGEKVKWRYVSSRLSSVTGRRATSATCLKKTKELFKLPSDKECGILGTSLPYVVHDAWNDIVEDEI